MKKFEYEVAFSYAGEQRNYVEEVAKTLNYKGVRVYCDILDEVNIWGKDLITHFEEIFGNKAEYIVMFISKEYAEKVWPSYEREVALPRWIKERHERDLLLPARFDDTKIPGLPSSIGYIDLNKKFPWPFADMIIEKIRKGSRNLANKED